MAAGSHGPSSRGPPIVDIAHQAPQRTAVLVADEAMLVRAGLRAVVESDIAFHVAGEATDGEQALEFAVRHRPALAIIGSLGSPLDTVALTGRLRAACPGTAIVVLAPVEAGRTLLASLRAGALGVLRTGVERVELMAALRRVLQGESVVDPAVATALMTRMAAESDLPSGARPESLTPREVEILRLVARGHTNREIAGSLILAVGTIKVHVEHILDKLGVNDRTQAAVRAVELGIAVREDPAGTADPRHRAA
jgi:DNA-binding NarL/FixJ family response regulator